MAIPTEPGIYPGIDRETYDKIDALNFSVLEKMKRSPAHCRAAQLDKAREPTDALIIGNAMHVAVLEPDRFFARYAVWDGGRRYGKEWDKFKDKCAGLEILTEDHYQLVKALASAVRADQFAGPLLRGGQAEVTLIWVTAGIKCKGRIDYATACIADLKSTRDAEPEAFDRQSWNLSYHSRSAWYQDGLVAAGGMRLPYKLVAVEKEEPHVVQVRPVDEDMLQLGRDEYLSLLQRYATCLRTNSWGGYSDGPMPLRPPRWARVANEDQDLSELGLVVNQ